MTRGAEYKPCQHNPLHRQWAQPSISLFTPCKATVLGTGYSPYHKVAFLQALPMHVEGANPPGLGTRLQIEPSSTARPFADRMTVLYGYKSGYKCSCLKSNKIYDVFF